MIRVFIAVLVVILMGAACSDTSDKTMSVAETAAAAQIVQQAKQDDFEAEQKARLANEAASKIKADAIAQQQAKAKKEARQLAKKRAQLDQLKRQAVANMQMAETIADAQRDAQKQAVIAAKADEQRNKAAEQLIQEAEAKIDAKAEAVESSAPVLPSEDQNPDLNQDDPS